MTTETKTDREIKLTELIEKAKACLEEEADNFDSEMLGLEYWDNSGYQMVRTNDNNVDGSIFTEGIEIWECGIPKEIKTEIKNFIQEIQEQQNISYDIEDIESDLRKFYAEKIEETAQRIIESFKIYLPEDAKLIIKYNNFGPFCLSKSDFHYIEGAVYYSESESTVFAVNDGYHANRSGFACSSRYEDVVIFSDLDYDFTDSKWNIEIKDKELCEEHFPELSKDETI